MTQTEIRFRATRSTGEVGAILLRPAAARALLVLAHGAGAGMRHPFLAALSGRLAARGVATFRWQFPYMESGARRPDRRPILLASVRSAAARAAESAPDLPLLAGGKSMGGRMTSLAQAEEALPGVRGLVFVGFPLHPAGRPAEERSAHLDGVTLPMLFLQGTRDALADLALVRILCERLGSRAALRIVDEADHAFHVRRTSGRTDEQVLDELASEVAAFASAVTEGA
jgi:hypothetical protein